MPKKEEKYYNAELFVNAKGEPTNGIQNANSLRGLYDQTGIAPATWSKIFAGECYDVRILRRAAEHFKIDWAELFDVAYKNLRGKNV